MRESELHVAHTALRDTLLPLLRGRVFHVRCASNVPAVVRSGAIIANSNGEFRSPFPSSRTSLFRQRGRVCLFDYRSLNNHELQIALDACAPDMASRDCNFKLAIMFLAPGSYKHLEFTTIDDWSKGMVIPYAEAGYPTAIPITAIEEKLEVTIDATRNGA